MPCPTHPEGEFLIKRILLRVNLLVAKVCESGIGSFLKVIAEVIYQPLLTSCPEVRIP